MAEWAKLHTDILDDPKLMRAARKGARWLLHLPWLIAFAKRADDGGKLTVNGEPAELADYLRSIPCTTEKAVTAALDELESLGILARELDGALSFTAWSKRQSKPSDDPEAVRERVKRHRANRKSKKTNESETPGNGDVSRDGNAGEEEREEEEEEKKNTSETRGGWPAEFASILTAIGDFEPGRVGSALARSVKRSGVERSREVVEAYAKLAPHQKADGSFDPAVQAHHFCTPERLAATWGFWLQHTEPIHQSPALVG